MYRLLWLGFLVLCVIGAFLWRQERQLQYELLWCQRISIATHTPWTEVEWEVDYSKDPQGKAGQASMCAGNDYYLMSKESMYDTLCWRDPLEDYPGW